MKIKQFLNKIFRLNSAERLANRNYKRYIKWLNAHAPAYASGRIEVQRVYTSKANDNYYLPKDLLMITMERKQKAEELMTALDFGMTKSELSDYLGKAIEALKKLPFEFGNKQSMQKLHSEALREISELQFRCNNIKSEDIILEIALLYFLIDDEDPYTLNELTIQRKKKLTKEDDALRAFFLKTIVALLKEATRNESAGLSV